MTDELTRLERHSLGFWIYLMTDCLLFGALFATFIVLRGGTNGGPAGTDIFHLPFVLTETIILLTSSLSCGLMLVLARAARAKAALGCLLVTLGLGVSFLALELSEFSSLVHDGFSWQHSAFLSAFFTLVGTHGAHITVGIIWLAVLGVRLALTGLSAATLRRLTLVALFWHFLDVIWIFIFTIVYLMGVQ